MSAWGDLVDYLSTGSNWSGRRGIGVRVIDHVRISAAATGVAAAAAIPGALWLGHIRRGGALATAVVNLGRAVPSFAIVALALPFSLRFGFGLGFWPTMLALVALALPPIFANTHAGVVGVDPAVIDAARGMGMRGLEVLWRVEAPGALPLLVTGLRIAAVQVIATATLGAFVGFGGLGAFIYEGFRQNDDGKLLTGAVLVAVLAVATELLFGVGQRLLTPWQTRKANT